jgi:hypothetical protein
MVYVNSSAFLSPSSAITASAWFRRIGTSGTQAQILASRWGLANSYALYYRDDTDQMALSVAGLSGSPVLATASIEDAQWHHAVGTYDGSNLRLYLDGVLIGSPLPATGSITDNGEPLQIGYEADGFGASPFNGDIDEVRIYNRALSATEIAKLYGSGAVKFTTSSVNLQQGSTLANGLVGHWTFDGPDVTDKVYDRSGQNNHGYFIGGATSSAKVIGKLGQALTFDGTGQHVNIADDPSLAVSTITVSGWVKTRSYTDGGGSLLNRRTAGNVGGFTLETGIAGVWNWYAYIGGQWRLQQTTNWATNQRQHMAVTYDGSNMRTYRDGVEIGSPNAIAGSINDPSSPTVQIGKNITGSFYYDGILDDVRIYNRALSPTEVKQLYQLGTVRITQ